uniref:Uncharacterized protein n=1 Tax=Heterorhabditis bacteriophora TaxID=37862 RepID=A0A1I7XI04_HETBA
MHELLKKIHLRSPPIGIIESLFFCVLDTDRQRFAERIRRDTSRANPQTFGHEPTPLRYETRQGEPEPCRGRPSPSNARFTRALPPLSLDRSHHSRSLTERQRAKI